MEEMKINSKILYNRARVRNGYAPHRMLKMAQEIMRERLSEKSEEEVIR
ncbi:MAG: hypothetical protein ACFFES_02880 [Candidatus Thorarchaeota archaeon]